jgi:hypothetical protein
MADKKFTFFEFHLHDSDVQFGPSAPDEGVDDLDADLGLDLGNDGLDDLDIGSADESDDGSCPGRSVGKLLLALVAVVAVVVAAKKLLGGDEDLSELEELDESA